MYSNDYLSALIHSPVRHIEAKVELYDGSTLADTWLYTDRLISFTVERLGENKFFGFGVCQKINVKLIDKYRELNITTSHFIRIKYKTNDGWFEPYPKFCVSEVHRDEMTNMISITAYDFLYDDANTAVLGDLELELPYTIGTLANACATHLTLDGLILEGFDDVECFNTAYEEGGNYEGTETVREVLTHIAEATQSIYFVSNADTNKLHFKRLDFVNEPLYTIDKSLYFDLDSSTNRRLGAICSATELGDNIIARLDETGTTQYVRDNPLWELREDIAELVEKALEAVGGMTVNQFSCSWRGNPLLEIGDRIGIITKDNEQVLSYYINDSVSYNGAFSASTSWSYTDDDDTSSNPSYLGDVLKQTFAKVDKVNKEITLMASDIQDNYSKISQITLDTEEINASVSNIQINYDNYVEANNQAIQKLEEKVSASITSEDVEILIQESIIEGSTSITTETGYTFSKDGLIITNSENEMNTTITEDGMVISKGSDEMLVANNAGVNAQNLHATTYLIIGQYSRFEDFERDGEARTGCFWIGG